MEDNSSVLWKLSHKSDTPSTVSHYEPERSFEVRMMITMVMLAFLAMAAVVPISAFLGPHPTTTIITAQHQQQQPQQRRLVLPMIDRNVADMIDQEYYRQHHKEEYHARWMVQHQPQLTTTTTTTEAAVDTYHNDDDNDNDDMMLNRRQLLRDEKLARTDPQQYCRDRCIATGYCDVYEDFFDFTPEQVMEFCTDCVLATDHQNEECSIPDAFYDHMTTTTNPETPLHPRP